MKKVMEKIHTIMKEMGWIEKDGWNAFNKYKYVTEANLVAQFREKLIEHRLMLTLSVESHEVIPFKNANGAAKFMTTLKGQAQFYDLDSGEIFERGFVGQGEDSGDKGAYKAYTGANKYVIMKTLQLPTGDDPEADQNSSGGDSGNPPQDTPDESEWKDEGEHTLKVASAGAMVANGTFVGGKKWKLIAFESNKGVFKSFDKDVILACIEANKKDTEITLLFKEKKGKVTATKVVS